MECGFAGNADIYGIGIRIGYYTQALAVWFAGFFHFREAQVLQETNKIFLFALVIAGFIYVSKAQTTYAVEAFLLLQIGLVIGLISVMDSKKYSSRYSRTSVERLISRLTIMGAGLLFNVCFWWRGLDIMLETPCRSPSASTGDGGSVHADENATYIWFFARFSIYGWLRVVGRAMSLYLAIGSVLTLGFADVRKQGMLTGNIDKYSPSYWVSGDSEFSNSKSRVSSTTITSIHLPPRIVADL
ncbi:phenylalanine aminomutase (L-beta-phenylalanine forming) [Physcia stellaris]|nr:phenylalanine aminomutase (L-beta-phenylalanine forming) [Physcia stellaris]